MMAAEVLAQLRRMGNEGTMHSAKDAMRYQMNSFVISVGSFIVPFAPEYIQKIQGQGTYRKEA